MLVLFCAWSVARAEDVSTAFDQANKLYEEGKFSEAAAAYDKMLEQGEAAPALYFNLGNALFKAGQVGRAVLNYRLAERLAPRDPDIRANLKFARNSVATGAVTSPSWWQRWTGRLTLDEWTVLTFGSLWLWLGLLTLGRHRWCRRRAAGVLFGPGKLQPFCSQVCHRGGARGRRALRAVERIVKLFHGPRRNGVGGARFQRRVGSGLRPRQKDRLVAPRTGFISSWFPHVRSIIVASGLTRIGILAHRERGRLDRSRPLPADAAARIGEWNLPPICSAGRWADSPLSARQTGMRGGRSEGRSRGTCRSRAGLNYSAASATAAISSPPAISPSATPGGGSVLTHYPRTLRVPQGCRA